MSRTLHRTALALAVLLAMTGCSGSSSTKASDKAACQTLSRVGTDQTLTSAQWDALSKQSSTAAFKAWVAQVRKAKDSGNIGDAFLLLSQIGTLCTQAGVILPLSNPSGSASPNVALPLCEDVTKVGQPITQALVDNGCKDAQGQQANIFTSTCNKGPGLAIFGEDEGTGANTRRYGRVGATWKLDPKGKDGFHISSDERLAC